MSKTGKEHVKTLHDTNTTPRIEEMVEEFVDNYYSEGKDGGTVFSTGFNGQLVEEWLRTALTQAHQAGIDEAVEIVESLRQREPSEEEMRNDYMARQYQDEVVGHNIVINKVKKALQDKK